MKRRTYWLMVVLGGCAGLSGPGRRGPGDPAHPRGHPAHDLQLGRHHHGPRAPAPDRQGGRQPYPVLLGEHPDRPDQHRVQDSRPPGQSGPGGYHVPVWPQRCPAMEHHQPDGGQDRRRDPLLHQRHHLERRLRGHRQRGRDEAQRDRLRAGDQQLGRSLRQRPDAARGGQDQSGGEDSRSGEETATGIRCLDRSKWQQLPHLAWSRIEQQDRGVREACRRQ